MLALTYDNNDGDGWEEGWTSLGSGLVSDPAVVSGA